MAREIRFKKQYKPPGFGDKSDSGTVEGHQKAMAEAAETRQYNRAMKELAAKRETERSLTSRLLERIARTLRFQRDRVGVDCLSQSPYYGVTFMRGRNCMSNPTAKMLMEMLESAEGNIEAIETRITSEHPQTSAQLLIMRNLQNMYRYNCERLREAIRQLE